MKPVKNNTTPGCSAVSSQCVIWQGPDIPCINLCKGDTIDDVVYKLATLLCESTNGVIDISTLDFKCLVEQYQSDPQTLIQLLQLLIDKTCELEDLLNTGGRPAPEPVNVLLPPALRYTNEDGDFVEVLEHTAYSRKLAAEICDLILDIAAHNTRITNLESRVTTLENTSGGGGSASVNVTPQCVGTPGTPTTIQNAFLALEDEFCDLRTTTGTTTQILQALTKQCNNLGSQFQLSGNGSAVMAQLPGWVNNPQSIADTLNNLWLTICDIRNRVDDLGVVTSVKCTDLIIDFLLSLNQQRTSASLTFAGLSTIPSGLTEQSGTKVRISWNNGANFVDVPFTLGNFTSPDGGPFEINLASLTPDVPSDKDLTFTLTTTYAGSGLTCSKTAVKTSTFSCSKPAVSSISLVQATANSLEVVWVPPTGGSTPISSYTVALKNNSGSITYQTIQTSQSTYFFNLLSASSSYRIEVSVNYECGTSSSYGQLFSTIAGSGTTYYYYQVARCCGTSSGIINVRSSSQLAIGAGVSISGSANAPYAWEVIATSDQIVSAPVVLQSYADCTAAITDLSDPCDGGNGGIV
jgi:hypothetical protein